MNGSFLRGKNRLLCLLILFFFLTSCMPTFETTMMEESSGNSPSESNPTATPEPPLPTMTAAPPTQTATPVPPTDIPEPTQEIVQINQDTYSALNSTNSISIESPRDITWNGDGTFSVLTANNISTVQLSDFSLISSIPLDTNTQLLDISPNGRFLAQTTDMFTINIIEQPSGLTIQTLEPGEQFMSAHFSPDNNRLLIPSLDNIKGIEYDIQTGIRLNEYTGFTFAGPVYDVFYSQYTNDLIWISRGSVRVMNRETGELSPYFGHEDFVGSLALNPQGTILVTASAGTIDGEFTPILQFWDRFSGENLGAIPAESYCRDISFTPDGTLILGAIDQNLVIWDALNRTQLLSRLAHSDTINIVSLSPDGSQILTASFDNTISLWSVAP